MKIRVQRTLGDLSKRLRFSLVALLTAVFTIAAGIFFSAAISAQTLPGASAGDATTFNRTSSAYEDAPPNLTEWESADHDLGDEAFEESFVSTPDADSAGLGPVFNNASCVSCHIRNGRGMPCLLYTSPSPRDQRGSRMPSSA